MHIASYSWGKHRSRGFEKTNSGQIIFIYREGSINKGTNPQRPDRLRGPCNLLPNGFRGLFPWEVKRQERETDNSPLLGAEVKKSGAIPPLQLPLEEQMKGEWINV
jgi:hypothetical protein